MSFAFSAVGGTGSEALGADIVAGSALVVAAVSVEPVGTSLVADIIHRVVVVDDAGDVLAGSAVGGGGVACGTSFLASRTDVASGLLKVTSWTILIAGVDAVELEEVGSVSIIRTTLLAVGQSCSRAKHTAIFTSNTGRRSSRIRCIEAIRTVSNACIGRCVEVEARSTSTGSSTLGGSVDTAETLAGTDFALVAVGLGDELASRTGSCTFGCSHNLIVAS